MLVVGSVIGSGIFRKPGVMAAELGSPSWLLAVWLIAGIITFFGALTNSEIAASIPETGGQYVFFERMYGSFMAFLYGWSMFAVVQCGSIAAVSYVFAEYATWFVNLPHASPGLADWRLALPLVGEITPLKDLGVKGLASVLVIGLTIANWLGVKFGGMIQNLLTSAKLLAIGALVLMVLTAGDLHPEQIITNSEVIKPMGLAWWLAMAAALQGAFWAYDGWNSVTFVAGEVKSPQRNLPRGLLIGTLIVTVTYVLINIIYELILPIDAMAQSKLVAADVANACISGGGKWIAAAVMLSTFGTTNSMILSSARIYFAMGQRGVFPQNFGRVHERFKTPTNALLFQGLWSILLIFSGTFDMITDMLIFVTWIFYAAGAAGIFVLRRREPDLHRPFRVPLYPWIPLAFVLFATVFLVLTLFNDVNHYQAAVAKDEAAVLNCVAGAILVFAGTPIYFYCRNRNRSSSSA